MVGLTDDEAVAPRFLSAGGWPPANVVRGLSVGFDGAAVAHFVPLGNCEGMIGVPGRP